MSTRLSAICIFTILHFIHSLWRFFFEQRPFPMKCLSDMVDERLKWASTGVLPSLDWLMLNLLRTFPRSLRNDEFNNKSLTLMMIDWFPFSKSSWLLPCPSFQIISVSLTYSFLSCHQHAINMHVINI
jgi:hypothetical protein